MRPTALASAVGKPTAPAASAGRPPAPTAADPAAAFE
ncbi:hypothetical protein X992_5933 [Burkholderia pseudomallei MSHR5492]|nr:hypothetical protein X992_5933 [Burkholderia pseudomallei MSHR5492]